MNTLSRFDLAKQVSILDYLQSVGIKVTERNGKFTAKAEWRGDTNPSVQIRPNENRWHDFGTGQDGSIIDLVCIIEDCDPICAVNRLLSSRIVSTLSFKASEILKASKKKSLDVTYVCEIQHPALKSYLWQERRIPDTIYTQHLKEVHYKVGGNEYFAVGFRNDMGGWTLRNARYKGCTSPNITHICNGNEYLLVFEGVFDFLTYLTITDKNATPCDYLILNSTVNTSKTSTIIASYPYVLCYLDNDNAGRTAYEAISSYCIGGKVSDCSSNYEGYNDLNEWHVDQINTSKV